MTNFKKKFLAGILSGALLLTGAQAFANPPEPPQWTAEDERQAAENISGWVNYLSDEFGADPAQVEDALNRGVHIRDIQYAALLSKLSGKSFSDVLAMKLDWFQVAEKLGVTREQIEKFYRQQMDTRLAKNAEVDVKTVQSLLKDGYAPHDIMIAGKIAKSAGKDIKAVLGKRKINNTWSDVAKSFGVDIHKVMPPEAERPRQ